MNPAIPADIIIVIFIFISERFIRKPGEAKSFRVGRKLDVTTQIYFYSVLFVLLSGPFFNYFNLARINNYAFGWLGILLLLIGIAIRLAAMFTLGKFYTRALVTTQEQKVVDFGIYKYVRHPGYAGTILGGIGFSMAQMNWLTLALTFIFATLVYGIRINKEEKMLKEKLGDEYREYMKRTKRLIPFIY